MIVPLLHIVFGWPSVVLSVLLTSGALARRSPGMAAAGALASVPFMFHLLGTPPFHWAAVPITVAHAGAAWSLPRRRTLAAVLFAPYLAAVAWMAMLATLPG